MNIVLEKLDNARCDLSLGDNSISIKQNNSILGFITTDVHPGFPTDLQAQWIALMSVADGTSVVTETIYLDRFSHVPELVRLGANITLENNIAIVRGQKSLTGAQVMSTDIRASASLVIAVLIADECLTSAGFIILTELMRKLKKNSSFLVPISLEKKNK